MMTNVRLWKQLISATLILCGLISGHSAFAVSVGGASGYANNHAFDGCFAIFGEQVQYTANSALNCAPTDLWTVPLPANAGGHSVAVSGTNNSSLSCILCSTDQSGNLIACPNIAFLAGTSVKSASVTMPNNGGMFLQCSMGANSTINTINYTQ